MMRTQQISVSGLTCRVCRRPRYSWCARGRQTETRQTTRGAPKSSAMPRRAVQYWREGVQDLVWNTHWLIHSLIIARIVAHTLIHLHTQTSSGLTAMSCTRSGGAVSSSTKSLASKMMGEVSWSLISGLTTRNAPKLSSFDRRRRAPRVFFSNRVIEKYANKDIIHLEKPYPTRKYTLHQPMHSPCVWLAAPQLTVRPSHKQRVLWRVDSDTLESWGN